MILNQQAASKVLPLITNLEAYEAYLELIAALKIHYYNELVQENSPTARGALLLLDELKELRVRLKDSLKNDRH